MRFEFCWHLNSTQLERLELLLAPLLWLVPAPGTAAATTEGQHIPQIRSINQNISQMKPGLAGSFERGTEEQEHELSTAQSSTEAVTSRTKGSSYFFRASGGPYLKIQT